MNLRELYNEYKPVNHTIRRFINEIQTEVLIVIPSGWMDMFHVIIENGPASDTTYQFLHRNQIEEQYNLKYLEEND
jgi:hypothetical protein